MAVPTSTSRDSVRFSPWLRSEAGVNGAGVLKVNGAGGKRREREQRAAHALTLAGGGRRGGWRGGLVGRVGQLRAQRDRAWERVSLGCVVWLYVAVIECGERGAAGSDGRV